VAEKDSTSRDIAGDQRAWMHHNKRSFVEGQEYSRNIITRDQPKTESEKSSELTSRTLRVFGETF